ncbi:hypothetical protein BpHYR1_049745 [Brachionus plicatilis]|uniref:Uncharacterized protein n=1 Tax=Brachionus plicatilis TaxID=10195 RepID=A0A3M7Q5Q6_BRAPC|nr:hypothetical protein BpHYR1_049745 [Brachionus plicatilis]
MTNLLQPADVAWFASLKKGYRKKWNNWYMNDVRVFTNQGNAKSPGYAKCVEWLGELWNNFETDLDVIEVDFQELHGPLKEMVKKKIVINSYLDKDCELQDANMMFSESNDKDLFGEDDSTSASAETEQGVSPDENEIPEQTDFLEMDNDLMTTQESALIQNLKAAIPRSSSNQLSLKDATNILNLERIKLPTSSAATDSEDKENEKNSKIKKIICQYLFKD